MLVTGESFGEIERSVIGVADTGQEVDIEERTLGRGQRCRVWRIRTHGDLVVRFIHADVLEERIAAVIRELIVGQQPQHRIAGVIGQGHLSGSVIVTGVHHEYLVVPLHDVPDFRAGTFIVTGFTVVSGIVIEGDFIRT